MAELFLVVFSCSGAAGFVSSLRMAGFPALPVSNAPLSLDHGAGSRMREFAGPLEAGPEVLSILPVVLSRILLHEGVAMEQLLLLVSGAGDHQQGDNADDTGARSE